MSVLAPLKRARDFGSGRASGLPSLSRAVAFMLRYVTGQGSFFSFPHIVSLLIAHGICFFGSKAPSDRQVEHVHTGC